MNNGKDSGAAGKSAGKPEGQTELELADPKPDIAEIVWEEFVLWEEASRDTIDLKKIYIDMADGDIVLGVWISQQVYWELPNKQGEPRTTVLINDKLWVAKDAQEWWAETRLREKPLYTCIQYWITQGIIECETHTYKKSRKRHTRIIQPAFIKLFVKCLMATYSHEQVAKRRDHHAHREFLLLHRLYRDNVSEENSKPIKKIKKKSNNKNVDDKPPHANLVREYIDQCTARGFAQKPGPQDIGLIGQIAAQGVKMAEFGAMIGCAPSAYRLSVSYLHRHTATLRSQARESGLYKPEELPKKNTKSFYLVECDHTDCGYTLRTDFDARARPVGICGKNPDHQDVSVRIVNE